MKTSKRKIGAKIRKRMFINTEVAAAVVAVMMKNIQENKKSAITQVHIKNANEVVHINKSYM